MYCLKVGRLLSWYVDNVDNVDRWQQILVTCDIDISFGMIQQKVLTSVENSANKL